MLKKAAARQIIEQEKAELEALRVEKQKQKQKQNQVEPQID